MFCSKTLRPFPRGLLVLGMICGGLSFAGAQETILESYGRIFIRSSLNTKVNVLADAATDEAAPEFYGALCELALRFVMGNAPLFREDPDMLSITLTAVKGLGEYAYGPGAETLWQVFLHFPDRAIRYEILKTLPVLKSPALASEAASFLAEQNSRYGSELGFDPGLLSGLFGVLGALGDDGCYPVLFASTLIYSGDLETEARRALYAVPGDLTAFCQAVILRNPPEEKLEAFRIGMNREGADAGEQSLLAEAALEAALASSAASSARYRELCDLALRFIGESGAVRSLPLVLKYYNQVQWAFRSDPSRREELAAAIACLSALRDAESARALGLQLGLYNSRSGPLSPEEEEIALALIGALGGLAYKASRDTLYYAAAFSPSGRIREAAEEALAQLRW
ncbi:MAG: hypothetical protein LBD09_02975 [Treponema sp.]|jgi:hypothetical protein|nr:hypothetical protein [Treponema sp.]